MIEPAARFRSDFERLVADEGLDDGSWSTETFAEVPLYSRLSQVMFLGRLPARERAAQLITAGAWQLGRLRDRFAEVRFLLVILDGAQLADDGLVRPAVWYTNHWSELSSQLALEPPLSELARFTSDVLGPAATVHDAAGRVYVDL